ncbi:molecular chaperone OsmY [Pragia fontium]|uniref:Osmotically-inducible protein Y n=1 Tax=Pragia fontium DSM 5563 = ATCC 49100 TaxID=1122977 RepID=A0AAJ5BFU7_9GAMM|nr:molecular chaperone OsmY [Pragia fontium]SFC05034.1 hyperosmotically inducible protein [Pragia fontium DSM 5563 = ATCC 49100]
MKNISFTRCCIAAIFSTAVMGSSAFAQETIATKAENVAEKVGTSIDKSVDKVGESIDHSMKKIDGFMDDSTITAKVKSALLDQKSIQSTDISVKTTAGAVTLSGFVSSDAQSTQAGEIAKQVAGVKSVSNKLQVQTDKRHSVENYVNDSVITSEIKTKFLADKIVPARKIKVDTSQGVVLLTGTVDKVTQIAQAESIAQQVKGVKSVKNDLVIKQ